MTATEVPDTAAAMRLSGMEVTDAVEELSLMGCDFSSATPSLEGCQIAL